MKEDASGNNEAAKSEEPTQPAPVCELVFCGSTKWDLIGRKTIPKSVLNRGGSDAGDELLAPTRLVFKGLSSVKLTAIYSGCAAAHLVLIDGDGHAYGLGRNDMGQLAQPDLRARRHPVRFDPPLKDGERIVHAACGRAHTLLVSSLGRAFSAGNNSYGQLGNGSRTELKKPEVTSWQVVQLPSEEKAICASAGGDFSAIACESGAVFCAGSGQHGHLGNGRTGECITNANRIEYDVISKPLRVDFGDMRNAPDSGKEKVRIVQVASGLNHTLALDMEGKVWSWGFGGYGRLGHKTPQDELRPKKVDTFASPIYNLDMIACGQQASFAIQKNRKSCYMWGVTKKTGESNMYPKPQFDLQGWEIRSIGCGATSTVVAAERSVISWGGSPTFGELGYGEGKPKSSTKPKVMDTLEGLHAEQVAEGMAFTAILVRVENDEDKKIFDALPECEVEDEEGSKTKGGASAEKRKSAESVNGQPKAKSRKRRR